MDLFSVRVAYASVDSFVSRLNTLIINPLILLLFALAMVFFLYGVFEFIINQDNEEKRIITIYFKPRSKAWFFRLDKYLNWYTLSIYFVNLLKYDFYNKHQDGPED